MESTNIAIDKYSKNLNEEIQIANIQNMFQRISNKRYMLF